MVITNVNYSEERDAIMASLLLRNSATNVDLAVQVIIPIKTKQTALVILFQIQNQFVTVFKEKILQQTNASIVHQDKLLIL
jgi:hypothetical protein